MQRNKEQRCYAQISKQRLPALCRLGRKQGKRQTMRKRDDWKVSCMVPWEGGGSAAIIFTKNSPHENLRWEFLFPPGKLGSDFGVVMLYWKYFHLDQTSSQKVTVQWRKKSQCSGVKSGSLSEKCSFHVLKTIFWNWLMRQSVRSGDSGMCTWALNTLMNLNMCYVRWVG